MGFTVNDVAKLERAIASGTLRVTFGDQTVQYQSLESMRAARREMLTEIAAAAPTRKARRRTFRVTQTGNGY